MKTHKYFEFCVSLLGIEPAIFRRFLLREDATFEDLHRAIQDAAGWKNFQPYLFWSAHGNMIARKDDWLFKAWRYPLGKAVPLASYFMVPGGFPLVTQCVYEYEPKSWYCEVVLEDDVHLAERFARRLLAGARAFPLEGCRGMEGYRAGVQVAYDAVRSGDPDYFDEEGWMDFLGDWRPDRFDLAAVKRAFDRRRLPRRGASPPPACIPGLEDPRPGRREQCHYVSEDLGGRCENEVVEGDCLCTPHGGRPGQLPEWVQARWLRPAVGH